MIGGWGNQKVLIRRKKQDEDKTVVDTKNILTSKAPLKVTIDIQTDGEIRVYIEHENNPIATWKDPSPLPIKYFGFAAYDNTLNRYFFNCRGEQSKTHANLEKSCKKITATDHEYKDFLLIPSNQPPGFLVNFPVYVTAARDAHILLASEENSSADFYEICKLRHCI